MVTPTGICVCAIFKDEAPFLREWIVYHRLLGVNKFVLFDNGSTDGGRENVLETSLKDFVTIIDWPERPGQLTAYQNFIENHAPRFEWTAFIDVDEFIHPLLDQDIPQLLLRSGKHSAMLIQWMNFGPAGHRTRPDGLVLDEYTLRIPLESSVNRHVKSIVRSSAIVQQGGCHVAQIRGEPCDADGKTITNTPIQPDVCQETAVINHYYTKSWEDWRKKVGHGRASTSDDPTIQRKLDWFYDYERRATELDARIDRFLPAVRRAMSELQPHTALRGQEPKAHAVRPIYRERAASRPTLIDQAPIEGNTDVSVVEAKIIKVQQFSTNSKFNRDALVLDKILRPAMSQKELELLESFLRCSKHYLEFGTGGSTVLAASHVRETVTSVDSSEAWLAKVAESCVLAETRLVPVLVHVDIGPVRSLGYPADETDKVKWPNYVSAVWDVSDAAISDLCLIDGRFRVASFVSVLLHCSPQVTVMLHDFPERKYYHVVRQFADEIAATDSLVVFRRATNFSAELALEMLDKTKFNPE
jgi:hypothetical protein